jgi:hypothetical protein
MRYDPILWNVNEFEAGINVTSDAAETGGYDVKFCKAISVPVIEVPEFVKN